MSSSAPVPLLLRALRGFHRRFLLRLTLWAAVRMAAAVLAALVLALALGFALPVSPATAWARRLALGLAALTAAWMLARRWRRQAPSWSRYLELAEARFPQLRSWLRNAVELDPEAAAHTSPELARAVQQEAARRLKSAELTSVEPRIRPAASLLTSAGAVGLAAGLALLAPATTQRAWSTLWDPGSAAPPVRIEVSPGDVRISPGSSLTVRARIWGTAERPTLQRQSGPRARATAEGARTDGSRLYRFELDRLSRDDVYRVAVGRSRSADYRILLAGEPVATSFEVEYTPPRYARMPVQRSSSIRGDLSALRGSRARITVSFDRDLESLRVQDPSGASAEWRPLTPRRWQGELIVRGEGSYRLEAKALRGRASLSYRVDPLPDEPPVLVVQVPQGDVELPAGQRIPLAAWGTDDLGLSGLRLVFRKGDEPWKAVPLASFNGQPREAHFEGAWDASPLALLPGSEASFRLELADNDALSGPQVAVSQTFILRFPGLAELYHSLEEAGERREQSMEDVVQQARELEKSLEKAARQRESNPTMSFERREEVQSALRREQQLVGQLQEVARDLRQSLEQAAERSAYDEQLTRKLQELAQLMQQIESPELRDAMKRVQEALQRLDKRALDHSLPDLRDRHRELLSGIERTLELLRRIREEETLQSAARRAEELARRQEERNREMEESPSRSPHPLSQAQRHDAEEGEKLAKDVEKLSSDPASPRPPKADEQLEQASKELSQEAAPSQQQAAQQLEAGRPQLARPAGERAQASLRSAAQELRSAAQQMSQSMDMAMLQAMRQVAQDMVSLSERAQQSASAQRTPEELSEMQRDLEEGTARVADSLFALGRQTPFLSQSLSQCLGRALSQFQQSGTEFSRGNRSGGEAGTRRAGESLNQAVLKLRQSEQSMCQNPGSAPGGRQAMSELSDQQSLLNQESRTIAKRLAEAMRLGVSDQQQLERLAARQQRIREGLQELEKRDQEKRELLGKLDQAQREMKEVEEILRRDPGNPQLEEKQQHILSRMLDAQRSIHQRDMDPERVSRPGQDVERESPPPLPVEMLRAPDRVRAALLKAEADRYPAQFRPFIEAYLRALNGSSQ